MPQAEVPQIDVISIVAHELRTPMTTIIGYLAVLKDELKDKINDEQKQFLSRVLSSSYQLSFLVDNILNFSRIERGTFTVNVKPTDWSKLLSQVVEEYQLHALQKNISLTLSLSPSLPQVLVDEMRIVEVLNNLLSNAISYTQVGGAVKVTAELMDGEVKTQVSDNGPGIPGDIIPNLFTKFYRPPESSTAVKSSGTGLGLYLCKTIVELHHGRIGLESEVGRGSTFYFTVPVVKA